MPNERCKWNTLVALACLGLAGCRSESAEAIVKKASVLAEGNAQGMMYWDVEADGDTRLVVKDQGGKVVKQNVTGQLSFATDAKSKPRMVELELDEDTGVVHADGPDLGEGVTEVKYALIANGKPRTGALHLPAAGTEGLARSAKQNEATAKLSGPHGGVVQIAGKNRYEVVANAESGEARVYLLEQAAVKPKKLELALDAETPRVVVLKWHVDGYYFAHVGVGRAPRKTTLVVHDDNDVHIVLIGFRPGIVVKVDAQPVYWVRRDWGHPGLARGHYKGDPVRGPPGQSKLMIKSKDQGKGGHSKVTIKSH